MPQFPLERNEFHLILWQRPDITKVVALHAFRSSDVSAQLSLFAVSIARSVPGHALLSLAPDAPEGFVALLRYLYFRVRPELFVALTDGSTWLVDHVRPPEPDAVQLLQLGSRRLSASADPFVPVTPSVPPAQDHRIFEVPGVSLLSAHLCGQRREWHQTFHFPGWEAHIPAICATMPLCDQLPVLGRLEVFTDGTKIWNHSLQAEVVAWAFVVVAYGPMDDSAPHLVGFASDMLLPSEDDVTVDLLASLGHDAYGGECAALYHALLWLCQDGHFQVGIPVDVVADCLSALHGMTGLWDASAQSFVSDVLRPLAAAVSYLGHWTARWQPSHVGHELNDCADFLAKMAGGGHPGVAFAHGVPGHLRCAFPWLWMFWNSELHKAGPAFDHDVMLLRKPEDNVSADLMTWPQVVAAPSQQLRLHLQVVSYNVNSLKEWRRPKGSAHSWTSRTELLQQQCRDISVVPATWLLPAAPHRDALHMAWDALDAWFPGMDVSALFESLATQVTLAGRPNDTGPLSTSSSLSQADVRQPQGHPVTSTLTVPLAPVRVPTDGDPCVDVADWLTNCVCLEMPVTWTIPVAWLGAHSSHNGALHDALDSLDAWFPGLNVDSLYHSLASQLAADVTLADTHVGRVTSSLSHRILLVVSEDFQMELLWPAVETLQDAYNVTVHVPMIQEIERTVEIPQVEPLGAPYVDKVLEVPVEKQVHVEKTIEVPQIEYVVPRTDHVAMMAAEKGHM
eukprot:Skav212533  [mRNA]  locus=scaffold1851:76526:86883:+ [translate_table: standard]